MTEHQDEARWSVADWQGKMLVDHHGEKIGKLVDVEIDEPQFGTLKEGFSGRHLTFVPLGGVQIGPDDLQVTVTREQVRSAPDIEMHGEELSQADESTLYHRFGLSYTPPTPRADAVLRAAENGQIRSRWCQCRHGQIVHRNTEEPNERRSPWEPDVALSVTHEQFRQGGLP